MISNITQQVKQNSDIQEDLVRHMVLTSILGYKRKFSNEYGKLIICCDDKCNWRKSVFSHYKANRKKIRERSSLDWNAVFDILQKIKNEIKEYFPYKYLQVHNAEADDIIAVICQTKNVLEKALVVSSDKDMKQLLRYSNVKFYSIYHKTILDVENPKNFLKEHILSGDSSDGIPNFLSADDTFVNSEKRQSPLTQKRLAEYMNCDLNSLNDMLRKNYDRNRLLIDLECIPEDVKLAVINEYNTVNVSDGKNLFSYFMKNRLKNLMTDLPDFMQ